jgi:hypothetical protein
MPVNRQEAMTPGVAMQKLKFVVARSMQRMHGRGVPASYYWI